MQSKPTILTATPKSSKRQRNAARFSRCRSLCLKCVQRGAIHFSVKNGSTPSPRHIFIDNRLSLKETVRILVGVVRDVAVPYSNLLDVQRKNLVECEEDATEKVQDEFKKRLKTSSNLWVNRSSVGWQSSSVGCTLRARERALYIPLTQVEKQRRCLAPDSRPKT